MLHARHSAGILPNRQTNDKLELFLAHPGGLYWSK
jgi:predicted NUDIX family NTP pyrophosphohydrolase